MLPRNVSLLPTAAALSLAAAVACSGGDHRQSVLDSLRRDSAGRAAKVAAAARAAADSARAAADTASTSFPSSATDLHPSRGGRPLGPLAQGIADAAVFAPRTQQWFVAAVRARRLLVDVGRLDAKQHDDAPWRRALAEVAEQRAPVTVGSTLRVRGPWGSEDVRVSGFDVWHGRLVATLDVSRSLDSLVRRREVAGTAQRIVPPADSAVRPAATDSAAPQAAVPAGSVKPAAAGAAAARTAADSVRRDSTVVPSCRDTLPTALATRAAAVRDSLVAWLSDSVRIALPRLARANRIEAWSAAGCFGGARAMVLVSRRNPTGELATDRAMLIGPAGEAIRLRVLDYRFHAHEPLLVADVDGDGVDDLVARGYGVFSGATTALRLDTAAHTLRRIAAGFAWESR